MRTSIILVMAVSLLVSVKSADAKKYTMKDLQALVKSESWQELVQHFEDIPPAQRNNAWNAVVLMSQRAAAGLKGFETCYKQSYSGGPCSERFLSFVTLDAGNVDLAIRAGQVVLRNQNHYFAMPYFDLAVTWAKGGKKVCTAERLYEALSAAMALPSSYTKQVAAGQNTATLCWPVLKKELLKTLEGGNSYVMANLCPVLKKMKASAPKCK